MDSFFSNHKQQHRITLPTILLVVGSSGLYYCLWLEEELGVDDIINTKHDNERLVILHHNEQAQPLDDAERSRGQLGGTGGERL